MSIASPMPATLEERKMVLGTLQRRSFGVHEIVLELLYSKGGNPPGQGTFLLYTIFRD